MRRTYNKKLGIYEELGKLGELPGPGSGGQSGDTQGLSGVASAASESVKELVEEGQYAEAALVEAIETMPDEDELEKDGEGLHTTQMATEDVPAEYLEGETPSSEEVEKEVLEQKETAKEDLKHPRGGDGK